MTRTTPTNLRPSPEPPAFICPRCDSDYVDHDIERQLCTRCAAKLVPEQLQEQVDALRAVEAAERRLAEAQAALAAAKQALARAIKCRRGGIGGAWRACAAT